MNGLHDLLAKIKKIEEAGEATAPEGEEARFAAYTKKQADLQANTALATKIQAMLLKQDDPNAVGKGYIIDPTNGMIFWSSNTGGAQNRPEPVRMDQLTSLHKDVKQLLDSAGVSVVPSKGGSGMFSYGAGYPSVPMDQVKLLQTGKLPQKAAPAAAPAAADEKTAKIKQLSDLLTTYPTLKESALFKSRIGVTLLELFDLGINEADAALTKADATKQINDLITYFKDPKFVNDVEVQTLVTKAIATISGGTVGTAPVTTADNSGAPPAATATGALPANDAAKPAKKLLPKDPNVEAYQNALIKVGVPLPKFGADGRWGSETLQASKDPKAQEINKQFADKVPQLKQTPAATDAQKVIPVPAGGMMTGKDLLGRPVMKGSPNDVSDKASSAFKPELSTLDAGNAQKVTPTLDPRGKPLVKDKNGNLGYYNNPVVPNKGFTIVTPAAQVKENIGFMDDELNRIVSLVHHR